MIQIQIKGLEKINNFLIGLPKNVEKEINFTMNDFAKFVQKSAKLRAPRFTGQLAESIMVKPKKNQIIISVESPYGVFQETGFTPHIIHRNMNSRAGYRTGDWMDAYGVRGNFMKVSKFTPFVSPALESGLTQFSNKWGNAVMRAIKNSGGKV
jgi:hypothetical protein